MYALAFELESFESISIEEKVEVLYKLLDALIHANVCWLRRNPGAPLVYSAGVPYTAEPPGRDNWQDIPRTLRLKEGDCEDLAAARVAELRVRFNEPAARPNVIYKQMGRFTLFHIQVVRADGSVEDPSKHLGMR